MNKKYTEGGDRFEKILQMRGVDTVIANLRYNFWRVWLKWHKACKEAAKREKA